MSLGYLPQGIDYKPQPRYGTDLSKLEDVLLPSLTGPLGKAASADVLRTLLARAEDFRVQYRDGYALAPREGSEALSKYIMNKHDLTVTPQSQEIFARVQGLLKSLHIGTASKADVLFAMRMQAARYGSNSDGIADVEHPSFGGSYLPMTRSIYIPERLHGTCDGVHAIVHEASHAIGFDYNLQPSRAFVLPPDISYGVEEIAAETSACMTLSHLGFDYSEYSAGYLNVYGPWDNFESQVFTISVGMGLEIAKLFCSFLDNNEPRVRDFLHANSY